MRIGDEIELTIDGQGMNGEGVARVDGVVVFVPYALVGERALCKVTFVKKNFCNARIVKLIESSPDRVKPFCSAFFKCGGCDYLHINPKCHKDLKVNELLSNFRKIAGEEVTLSGYVESDKQYGYRNKVQLPFGEKNGEAVLGYFANNTHDVIPHEECILQDEMSNDLAKVVLDYVNMTRISVYNERTHQGLLRHLVIRSIDDGVAIVLVINGDNLPHLEILIEALKRFEIDFSVFLNINKEDTNVILSDKLVLKYGEPCIRATILDTIVEVSPLAFMQVNDYIRDRIYTAVADNLQDVDTLIDLYSGIGITSNILAKRCKRVYSVEIVREAVENAKRLAELNHNANITTICGDCKVELPKLVAKLEAGETKEKFAVLLDPPRKGCDKEVIDAILSVKPNKIIYISCNHATLARDYNLLKGEYSIDSLTAYDMFPNTHWLESVLCLTRK